MDRRTLQCIEYAKVLELLGAQCQSAFGARLVRDLQPESDLARALDALNATQECWNLLTSGHPLGLGGLLDLSEELDRLQAGGSLQALPLWRIGQMIAMARQTQDHLRHHAANSPWLLSQAERLFTDGALEQAIANAVDADGLVRDGASPLLADVRRQIVRRLQETRERLDGLIRSARGRRILQEPVVAMRGEHFVLLVKQEYRQELPGLVHDISQSGATLFVEPLAVVELGHAVSLLREREKREIERILAELSARLAPFAVELAQCQGALAQLDVAAAKARLALQWRAIAVRPETDGVLHLDEMRHPLLGPAAVPISLEVGGSARTLVLSGPNTGGKTAALKCCGLAVAMAHTGMFLPARSGTRVPWAQQLHVVLGDEQSLEQSLSTFSAHLQRLKEIMEAAGPHTVVLIDEIGAGTDPREGAALAAAVLEVLADAGCLTVVTTHQGELKRLAEEREEVRNAAVEFDPRTLQPTYRIQMGLPGPSLALAIAEHLGLSATVLASARERLTRAEVDLEEVLRQATLERDMLRREQQQLTARLREAEEHAIAWHRQVEELASSREQTLAKAKSEARELLREARLRVHAAAREMKRAAAQETTLVEARAAVRELLEEADPESAPPVPEGSGSVALRQGMAVHLRGYSHVGTVAEVADAGRTVWVEVGPLRVRVAPEDLIQAPPASRTAEQTSSYGPLGKEKAEQIHSELDVRGQTVDEAWRLIDKYLDDAVLAGLSTVRLIHGKGTGALRRALQDRLRDDERVTEHRLGGRGEGDDGVTVVTLGP